MLRPLRCIFIGIVLSYNKVIIMLVNTTAILVPQERVVTGKGYTLGLGHKSTIGIKTKGSQKRRIS